MSTVDENSLKGKFSVTNPNFKDSDKSMRLSVESLETDLLETRRSFVLFKYFLDELCT